MSNYNNQQQAVILKGIAQQILSMNIPTFEQVEKLFKQFEIFQPSNFDGNSFSLGFVVYKFLVNRSFSEDDAKRYLELLQINLIV